MENSSSEKKIDQTILNFTKESRLNRDKKITIKNFYHKKNKKSVQHYQQLALERATLEKRNQDLDLLKDELLYKEEVMNNHSTQKFLDINISKEGVILNNQPNQNLYKSNSNNYDTEVEQLLAIDKDRNRRINQNERASERKKQFLFDHLAKYFRKKQIFLVPQSSKGSHIKRIEVFITEDIKFNWKGKNHNFHLYSLVGNIHDFGNICVKHHHEFNTPFKTEIQNLISFFIANFNANDVLDKTLHEIFDQYENDEKIASFLPELEDQIFTSLKKPSKQNKGFVAKIHNLHSIWKDISHEVFHIDKIENELKFSSYEQSFPLARSMKRKFKIFIGPTNSGKTYSALNELANAKKGAYLGPLRLLAHEGKEALEERGVVASLVTGEERDEVLGSTHISSTIEMCSMNTIIDCAVIDEIQMIMDENRGWAWSQAVIGVPASTVILVGSEDCLPLVLPIIENLGEEYEIVRFERKNKLNLIPPMEKLKSLKAGDCVVVFSRKSALEMKNAIEATGKTCSVIYGNLSPEVRKGEAKKFKNGENPILVATDAIGMGLNLPISRLFFSTMEKYDGTSNRLLTISEVKQIAGRAGRYGYNTHGEVGLLFENNKEWANLLNTAIIQGYEKPKDNRVSIAPNLGQIQTICDTLNRQELYSALIFFTKKMLQKHELYKTANLEDMINIARLLKDKNCDLERTMIYSCVPIDIDQDMHMSYFFRWFNAHEKNLEVLAPDLPEMVKENMVDSVSLFEAELYVKLCMCYRWLHYKFPQTYNEIEDVTINAKFANEFIERALNKHIKVTSGGKKKGNIVSRRK